MSASSSHRTRAERYPESTSDTGDASEVRAELRALRAERDEWKRRAEKAERRLANINRLRLRNRDKRKALRSAITRALTSSRDMQATERSSVTLARLQDNLDRALYPEHHRHDEAEYGPWTKEKTDDD